MKLSLATLALSCLAGNVLAAPAQKASSQGSAAAAGHGQSGDPRQGNFIDCAAYLFDNAVDGTLRKIKFLEKILPDPTKETLCLRLKKDKDGGEAKGGEEKGGEGGGKGEDYTGEGYGGEGDAGGVYGGDDGASYGDAGDE